VLWHALEASFIEVESVPGLLVHQGIRRILRDGRASIVVGSARSYLTGFADVWSEPLF
jgi:hypothetical protein